jgi:hypothetical protein
MCLIFLIIAAIITIIILSSLGIGKGNFNVPDKISWINDLDYKQIYKIII